MTLSSTSGLTAAQTVAQAADTSRKAGLGALGQGDFLRLLTVQMQQQDPFDPVDQKEMLAQMAQFSSLAGISEVNQTLKSIAARLDAIASATPTNPTPAPEA